uniref:Reverse transcriptase domain-containing protein n=1 Tax=Cannabis sativa TaxID=3483 RepID=A0A803NKB3_CANSA
MRLWGSKVAGGVEGATGGGEEEIWWTEILMGKKSLAKSKKKGFRFPTKQRIEPPFYGKIWLGVGVISLGSISFVLWCLVFMETVIAISSPQKGKCFSCNETFVILAPCASSVKALSACCLYGKVIAPMSVDVSSVWDFVAKTWKKPVSVVPMAEDKKMTNTFKFGFESTADRDWALDNGPWCVRGYTLVMQAWSPSVDGPKTFNLLRVWIQIHNLPHEYFSRDNGSLLGGMVGKVIKIELEEDKPFTWTPFMKILVDIDVHKPLVSGYFFDLTSGVKQWLQVKYVKIGIFCYFCGCLGHQRRGCKLSSPVTVAKNDGVPFPMYGPWLSTSSTYHDVFSGPSFGTARQIEFSGVANSGGAITPLETFSADGGDALKGRPARVHRRLRRPLSVTALAATASGKAQRGVWFPKRSSAGLENGTSILSIEADTGFLDNEKGPASLPVLREDEVDRSMGREVNLIDKAVNLALVDGGPAIGPKDVVSGLSVLCGELEGDIGSGPKTVGLKSVGNGPKYVGSGLPLKDGKSSNGPRVTNISSHSCGPAIEDQVGHGQVGPLSHKPNVDREPLVHPNEDLALAQFFKAQEDLMHDLKHFGKLDLYEIRKIGENDAEIVVDDPSEDSSNSPSRSGILKNPLVGAMRGLAWNCRGLGHTSTVRELKSLLWLRSLDFVFLTELKVNANPLVRTLKSLHFYFNICVPSIGNAGGIILAWKEGFSFEYISSSCNHISGIVYSDPSSHPWLLSCVYGPPYLHAKKKFWSEFLNLGDRFGGPWLILGDTNFVLSASKREGSSGRDPFIPIISNLLNARGLFNLPIQGDNLTWDNHRSGRHHVKSTLDKGLVNGAWLNLFPRAVLGSSQTCNSDHRPLCLMTDGQVAKFKRSFKFEEGWTRDDRSNLVVNNAWNSVSHNWASARIFKRVGATRVALLNWSRTQFGKLDVAIKELENKLNSLQSLPAGSRDWDQERVIRRELNESLERKAIYWKQRARISWLKDGDKCSKFFFLSATIKGRRNAIESIINKDNAWISGREAVGRKFLDYFKGIFTESVTCPDYNCSQLFHEQIPQDELEALVCSPSSDEIKKTLFAMNSHKAPGPDGMSVLFYKHYWESIGADFCDAIQDFFVSGRMHRWINATNIVLIPKVQNPKRTNHFRPISLCNVVYKVIAKIIANRLKPILPSIICPTQAAFVPGRNIHDNNVIIQEIIHSFNRKKGKEGFFAIKIDLVKAYDRLSWKFIDHVLDCSGIPPRFRHWISQCISTTTLNVCLNGGQVGNINPSCGLRQGDPLSPYLFIWAVEVLSRLITDSLDRDLIKGIKLSRGGPVLSHIFFADDLILVGRANLIEANGFWSSLEQFCSWSGQQVNKLKTTIFFSKNTPMEMRRDIKEALGIDYPEGCIKYLGLPLFRSRQKDADFNFILDNLTAKLQGWKAKTLSKAGCATLIKFMGLSLPMYAMQTTKLSTRMVNRIDGLVCDFWWGFEKGNHGLHLKAWDKLCLPKSLGGLGFRKTREMNQAFLSKWGWNILNGSQSLCCKVLVAKYLRGKDFLTCRYKNSDSWFWKSVVKANSILRKGACKLIADGKTTSIWRDPWIPHYKGPLYGSCCWKFIHGGEANLSECADECQFSSVTIEEELAKCEVLVLEE